MKQIPSGHTKMLCSKIEEIPSGYTNMLCSKTEEIPSGHTRMLCSKIEEIPSGYTNMLCSKTEETPSGHTNMLCSKTEETARANNKSCAVKVAARGICEAHFCYAFRIKSIDCGANFFFTERNLWYDIRYEIFKNARALLLRGAQECQKALQEICRGR